MFRPHYILHQNFLYYFLMFPDVLCFYNQLDKFPDKLLGSFLYIPLDKMSHN